MTDTTLPNHTIADHIRRTLTLAWPVVMARMGLVGLSTVDVLVLGRAGTEELADYTLGLSIYDSLLATMAGLTMGIGVLTARSTGAGLDRVVGTIWSRGVIYGALLGCLMAALLQFAPQLFALLGQSPERAASAGSVTRVVALALPFVAIYLATASFLESLHHPMVGMFAVAVANISNLGLNVVLVFGIGPFPEMGAEGAALATVINSALLAFMLWYYTRYRLKERTRYGIGEVAVEAPSASEQRRIGYGAGLSYTFEAGAFVMMTLFVGWLGTIALAVQAVVFQYLAVTFMMALGVATATQVRVGNAWGRGDMRGMALAGWTGMGLVTVVSGMFAIVYVLFPVQALRVFTTDPVLLAAAAPVMVWMTLALIFDCNQSVMSHACRGRGDTWVPTAMHLVSYWMVMVPAGYWFGIRMEAGVSGIYQGIVLASVVSVTLMSLRFRHLTRQIA
ncbi:multidrug resistance protein, MATE family [Monaibacterium marinum]|uniref:Multidrug-efflux transporter n=1 Tax=Pontivivens marinum TaxID=1690039 RepID=A0A2C9CSF4_9RHOB|nr:MATE family efflux transporter [Monaibacterium marinum]SOH94143.1 multidrug resistance protein, MATE family [Monaibacterium marinum]